MDIMDWIQDGDSFLNGVRLKSGIKKIVINDPCVILISDSGGKWVVRPQEGDEFDPIVGVWLVLCKYLFPSKRYSEIVFLIDQIIEYNKVDMSSMMIKNMLAATIMPILGRKTLSTIRKLVDYYSGDYYLDKTYILDMKDILSCCWSVLKSF